MELFKRSLTGVLFVTLVVLCVISGPFWFAGFFAIIVVITLLEYVTIVNKFKNASINPIWISLSGLLLFLAFFTYCLGFRNFVIFVPFLLSMVFIFLRELFLKKTDPINNWALSVFGLVYIAIPFSILSVLAFNTKQGFGPDNYSYLIPLTLFVLIWCNDIGAYCVGRTLGRHKLFERISPNKTWEGSVGGAIFSIAVSLILSVLMPEVYGHLPVWAWAGMALVIVVFGTFGDLTESLMKRKLGIKDSGKILPGHGGLLDRFDSSLMAIPATLAYLMTLSLFL